MIIKPRKTAEFSLIDDYFKKKALKRADVLLGMGDDAAVLRIPEGNVVVMAVDTLVAGVHFPIDITPYDIGYKSLAVNLSDLAAMGAEPAWMMLALTMPDVDANWLEPFSSGLCELAHQYQVQLIGGDSTRGSLTVTVQVTGWLPSQSLGLYRHGAKAGDKLYVSGTLGDAGLGLQVAKGQGKLSDDDKQYVLNRLNRPTPRVKLGMLLRGVASSAIDVSDGLLADLGHVVTASNVGAKLDIQQLPLSSVLRSNCHEKDAIKLALTAGDDYELCFTVPRDKERRLQEVLNELDVSCVCIGEMTDEVGNIKLEGEKLALDALGFSHWM